MADLLDGFSIGITADRRSGEQISLLEGRGASCIHGPTLETFLPVPAAEVLEATKRVLESEADAFISMTGIGVRGWFEVADAQGCGEELRDRLASLRVFTRGPKALGALTTAGLDVDWVARVPTVEQLIVGVRQEYSEPARIIVQNDGAPESAAALALRDLGHEVIEVPVYRWALPVDREPARVLTRAVVDRRVDAVTFTSRPAVETLMIVADELGVRADVIDALNTAVLPVCVGPVCAAAVVGARMGEPIQPARYRLGAMVQQLTDALLGRIVTFRLGGFDLELRGHLVRGEGDDVMLAGRERDLLSALLARNGAVATKEELLESVWGSQEPGTHVVEVTVGRLRRRLGTCGVGIETVMRRGYRASPD